MRKKLAPLVISLFLCSTAFGAGAPSALASSSGTPTRADDVAAVHALANLTDGNKIYLPDGWVVVVVDAEVMSLGECPSGAFCMWPESNFHGSLSYRIGNTVTHQLNLMVRSVRNNRSGIARLYSNTGTTQTCYPPGASQSSVSSSYNQPAKVTLSSSAAC
jgi:hypothetical protein